MLLKLVLRRSDDRPSVSRAPASLGHELVAKVYAEVNGLDLSSDYGSVADSRPGSRMHVQSGLEIPDKFPASIQEEILGENLEDSTRAHEASHTV